MAPSPYAERPWLARYPAGMPAELPSFDLTVDQAFAATLRRAPAAPAIHTAGGTIDRTELDRASSATAAALRDRGVRRGDRVALFLQNDPQFVVAQLAAWKLGAVAVSVNPMSKVDELRYVLEDCGARTLVTLRTLHDAIGRHALEGGPVELVVTTDPADGVAIARAATGARGPRPEGDVVDLLDLVRGWDGTPVPPAGHSAHDLAAIGYTSGTSGRPKGVTTTHANIVHNVEVYRRWLHLGADDVWLCGAPLFHVTGLVAYVGVSHLVGAPLVLLHRFDAATVLDAVERWRTTATVMPITAFRALLDHPDAAAVDLSSLTKVYSGGAPVSREVSERWRDLSGHAIHNIYGLTETTSPSHAVPLGAEAPVDASSGALSVGLPVPGARVRVVDANLHDVAVGEPGEILVGGPMVTPGYWNRPDADRDAFHDGFLRTGDVGLMDGDGWFFVIDRLKDIINASGYKVSPREVEDCLCAHPAVLEAAVVGVPDSYRGETVKAFVTLRTGRAATPEELIAHCRERMSAYKYPRLVEIVDALPKTASGKILRRELRDRSLASRPSP